MPLAGQISFVAGIAVIARDCYEFADANALRHVRAGARFDDWVGDIANFQADFGEAKNFAVAGADWVALGIDGVRFALVDDGENALRDSFDFEFAAKEEVEKTSGIRHRTGCGHIGDLVIVA